MQTSNPSRINEHSQYRTSKRLTANRTPDKNINRHHNTITSRTKRHKQDNKTRTETQNRHQPHKTPQANMTPPTASTPHYRIDKQNAPSTHLNAADRTTRHRNRTKTATKPSPANANRTHSTYHNSTPQTNHPAQRAEQNGANKSTTVTQSKTKRGNKKQQPNSRTPSPTDTNKTGRIRHQQQTRRQPPRHDISKHPKYPNRHISIARRNRNEWITRQRDYESNRDTQTQIR